jgi:hypothetical protein
MFDKVLMMVYCTLKNYVPGLCPSSDVPKTQNVSEAESVSVIVYNDGGIFSC